MNVIDFLRWCAEVQDVPRPHIPDRIREMVRVCGLDREKHKKIGELSKGYRQRVGLAQAMIHDPEILILDEPTTGLDPNQIVEIRELIRRLGKEKTVILSTHILPEVEATCDRILIINRGRIVADGSPETLRRQAQGRQVLHIRLEEALPDEAIKAIMTLPTVASVDVVDAASCRLEVQSKPDTTSNRALFELCKERGWVLTEMVPFEQRLEDIFRNLTMN